MNMMERNDERKWMAGRRRKRIRKNEKIGLGLGLGP